MVEIIVPYSWTCFLMIIVQLTQNYSVSCLFYAMISGETSLSMINQKQTSHTNLAIRPTKALMSTQPSTFRSPRLKSKLQLCWPYPRKQRTRTKSKIKKDRMFSQLRPYQMSACPLRQPMLLLVVTRLTGAHPRRHSSGDCLFYAWLHIAYDLLVAQL